MSPPAVLRQRNGHLPASGIADPGWGQAQAWQMDGASPSVSVYDALLERGEPQGVLRRLFSGILTISQELPPSEPTMTRHARIGAQRSSLPASAFFQSYAEAGTGRATSPASEGGIAMGTRKGMSTASQRGAPAGQAELHPATTYDPFPSPGSLYPKVV